MSRGKLLLILIGILIVAIAGYFVFFAANSQDAVTQQLEAFRTGNVNTAYDLMSDEYKAVNPLSSFQQTYGNVLKDYRSLSLQVGADNNLFATVELNDGFIESFQYSLVKQGLTWKVNSIETLSKASEGDDVEINLESQ